MPTDGPDRPGGCPADVAAYVHRLMLFNSLEFLLLYLPLTLAGFFWIGRNSQAGAAAWLAAASLFFYGWWDPIYVPLLLGSISGNFLLGRELTRPGATPSRRRSWLAAGVAANLGLLGYFKYADFFVSSANSIAGDLWSQPGVILPLGISFYTFTQIAFLVDASRGDARELNFTHYGLFVSYFPHLIAGPVLHHKQMMPQFALPKTYVPRLDNFGIGLTVFAIGLFKKVVLADSVAPYASSAFQAADAGATLGFLQSWAGALSYTLQLYFDFSGYCDMAIGLSLMFGIRLPINFDSPYKARNIADFWRRWHITLSTFLRDYLYIALGGSRRGATRRYANLMITMLLGGLWHGAGWSFVIWGGLHGLYLIVHQAWLAAVARWWPGRSPLSGRGGTVGATLLTFLAVVIGWVFFRATSLHGALGMLQGMAGANGVSIPAAVGLRLGAWAPAVQDLGLQFDAGGGADFVLNWLWILALLPIVFFAPNSQDLMREHDAALDSRLAWRPTMAWACATAIVLALGLMSLAQPSEFLYYQF
jgi:alginate O-acetyltransferase complex protein AlgI